MDFGYGLFAYMAFCFMDFSLIWTILARTKVVHISGIGITYKEQKSAVVLPSICPVPTMARQEFHAT